MWCSIGKGAEAIGKKILIIVASLVVAFVVGSLFGFGYYQITRGPAIVSATPLEPSPPTKGISSPLEAPEHGNEPEVTEDEFEDPSDREEQPDTFIPSDEQGIQEETRSTTEDVIEENEEQESRVNEEKVAYITIDDGPHPKNTPAILAILEEFGIKATFFVLGTEAEKYPELIEQIYEAGHAIGNHTYNHIYKDTYASDESFWQSVQKTENIILDLIGEKPVLIREPGGRFLLEPEKQQMVRDRGYGLVHWNIDSYDSRSPVPDAETIFNNVKRQAQKEYLWPAMVILFHETGIHENTVEALPMVIQYLMEEGFIFKTIAEMDMETIANLPRP